MAEVVHEWHFARRDGLWECSSDPAVEENLRLAIETLADSFGTQVWRVRLFLDYWESVSGAGGLTAPVNTTTASVHPVDGRVVQINDKYGQFVNVEIEANDLKAALGALMAEMGNSFEQVE